MNTNPNRIITLAGFPTFRGIAFHPRGPLTETPIFTKEAFTRSASGAQEDVGSIMGYTVACEVASLAEFILPLFKYYAEQPIGRCLGPHHFAVTSVDSTTDALTITAHPFATGDAVLYSYDETDVSGGNVSRTAIKYARNLSTNTISLHATAIDAAANSAKENFTVNGACTGVWISKEMPLILNRSTGKKRTYAQALVTKLPMLKCAGGRLLVAGPMEFRALPAIGSVPTATQSDQSSFWAEVAEAYAVPSWDGDETLTQPVTAAWGASGVWNPFESIDGFTIEVEPQFAGVDGTQWREQYMRYTGCNVTVKCRPIGLTKPEYDNAMKVGVGELHAGNDLILSGGGVFTFTATNAVIEPAATIYDPSRGFVEEITFRARMADARPFLAPFTLALS